MVPCGGVDDELAVVTKDEVGPGVAGGVARPDRGVGGVVDDEVAVGLDDRVRARRIRAGEPAARRPAEVYSTRLPSLCMLRRYAPVGEVSDCPAVSLAPETRIPLAALSGAPRGGVDDELAVVTKDEVGPGVAAQVVARPRQATVEAL